jgi:MarR-like DNA-binding transcriptional regulator SgrR of sgrS sRNA
MTISIPSHSKSLTIDLFPLPHSIDSRSVKSAAEYVLLKHVTRGLVDLNKEGVVQADLAKSWHFSPQGNEIRFELFQNQYFSNGDKITAKSFANTIKWQKSSSSAIHVDFKTIKEVKVLEEYKLIVILNEEAPRFLIKLSHPEFGILHESDLQSDTPKFKISSGYYSIDGVEKNLFKLKRNPHAKANNDFEFLTFKSTDSETQYKDLISSKTDIAVPFAGKDGLFLKDLNEQKRFKKLEPHIGFTYWLGFNNKSKLFEQLDCRSEIYKIIKTHKFDISEENGNWQIANQLYLPLGPGRLSKDKETQLNKVQSTTLCQLPEKLKLLLPSTFFWNKELSDLLKVKIPKLEIIYYANQVEFLKKNTADIDMFVVNNDFSSLDLSENLFVTFNVNRPLIYGDQEIQNTLAKIKSESIDQKLYEHYISIGEMVLKKRLIVPLFYRRINFYYNPRIDLSEWSILFPEIAAWKIKTQD